MKVTNRDVARAWGNGFPMSAANLRTDGRSLYSYRLRIGFTSPAGLRILYNFRGKDRFISITTSHHVGIACLYADKVIDPPRRSPL